MLQGTIDEFPLIDVLGILQARNKTGRLEIERQAGRGLIYVRLGEPYYAESSLTRSLIGQKLVDIGAISDMQLRKALDRQAESGERLGQILLTHGVISADHVAQAVISQIKDALADLLAWEAGEFRWETGAEVEVEVPLFGADASLIGEGANSLIGEGANPLAPHVIPVNAQEPDTAPDSAESEAVVEETDFPRGGTTMTGNEVTANPNETFPDAGLDDSHEDVHSSLEAVDDGEETGSDAEADVTDSEFQETEPAAELDDSELESETEDVDYLSESEDDTEPELEPEAEPQPLSDDDEPEDESEPETELVSDYDEAESEPETEPVFDYNESEVESQPEPDAVENENASEPVFGYDENDDESETEPVSDYDEDGIEVTVNEPEVEPVSEFDEDSDVNETEQEDAEVTEPETVHEFDQPEDETEPETEAVAGFDEDGTEENETEPETEAVAGLDEDVTVENETEPETEAELSPVTMDSEARIELPDQFHVPRIIRSQPAPELDEEFEAVFEATAHASYEDEPVAEPVEDAPYFDSSYADERIEEPVAEAPTFDPPPAVDPVFGADAFTPIAPVTEFDHPTFVPDNGSADPVFDHGNFEPLPENPEPYDPVAETSDAVPFEPLEETPDEVPETSFDEVPETSFESLPEMTDEDTDEVPETSFESLPEMTDEDTDEVPETSFEALPDIAEPSFPPPFGQAAESDDEVADEDAESSFEPEVVAFDAPPLEPQVETPEPAFEMPLETVDELSATDQEADQPEPLQAAPHMPAADLMPGAVLPPPPPPEAAISDDDEDDGEDAATDEAPEPPAPDAPPSLKDIKLDRSSLVRELSDLLR